MKPRYLLSSMAAALAISSFSVAQGSDEPDQPPLTVELRLGDESGQQRFMFAPGETVNIAVTAMNLTDEPIAITTSGGITFSFKVFTTDLKNMIHDGTESLWRHNVRSQHSLAPGYRATSKLIWEIPADVVRQLYTVVARYEYPISNAGYVYAARGILIEHRDRWDRHDPDRYEMGPALKSQEYPEAGPK